MDSNITKFSDKHLISLWIIFFSPASFFYKSIIEHTWIKFDSDEIDFIDSYAKFWMIIGILVIFFLVLNYFILPNYIEIKLLSDILYNVVFYLPYLIFSLIIIWTFYIFSDKKFSLIVINFNNKINHIEPGNLDMIFFYIPLYNIFTWYKDEEYKNNSSNYWLKESLIIFWFFILFWIFFPNSQILVIICIFLIIRVITLVSWIDFFGEQYKKNISWLFKNNIEEIYWYFIWTFVYIFNYLKNRKIVKNPSFYIEQKKNQYSSILDLKYNNYYLIEYWIFFLIIIIVLYLNYNIVKYEIFWVMYYLPYLFLLFRYLIMIFIWKLVYIPIIHEVLVIIKKIIKF